MDEIDKLLEKSTDRLQAACQLYNSGFFEDSVSRSYYAMFYAARALLSLKRLAPRTHRGVIASVGDHFVKDGLMDYHTWKYLAVGESEREEADYSADKKISKENSRVAITHAKEFIDVCKDVIKLYNDH